MKLCKQSFKISRYYRFDWKVHCFILCQKVSFIQCKLVSFLVEKRKF
eukprot:UN22747